VASGKQIGADYDHGDQVSAVAFHPSGKRFATAGWNGRVRQWDVETHSPLGRPLVHDPTGNRVLAVAYTRDGTRLASAGRDATARIWDTATGNPVGEPIRHSQYVTCLDFSPDGGRLATGGDDGLVRCWDVLTRRLVATLRHAEAVTSVHFQPVSGESIVAAGVRGFVRTWQLPKELTAGLPLPMTGPVLTVAFGPDPATLMTAAGSEGARLWDPGRAVLRGPALRLETWWNTSADLAPDGKTVAASFWTGTVRRWDGTTGRLAGPDLDHGGKVVHKIRFTPDGRRLVTYVGDTNTVRVWDLATGRLARPAFFLNDPVAKPRSIGSKPADTSGPQYQLLAVAPDGTTALFGGEGRVLRRWSLQTGEPVGPPLPHGDWVLSAAFNPADARIVVTGCRDGSARLWDLDTGRPLHAPLSHSAAVDAVAFDSTGKLFFTGTTDGVLRVWDSATGLHLGPPYHHPGGVLSVAPAPDGSRIATGCHDGTARLWKFPAPPVEVEAAHIREWARSFTGFDLDEHNAVRVLAEEKSIVPREGPHVR
jgi:WD40 repeat protein